THLPAYLQLCGVAPGVGASALALIGLFNTVGTYSFGLLGARYSQKHLLALIYLLRTLFIVVFLLVPVSAASTLVFAAAMGLLWLGVAPLVTGIIGRVFGLVHFNTLYGIVFLSHQVGSFFGAWMGGIVYDRTGSYNVAWGALLAIGVTACFLYPTPHAGTSRASQAFWQVDDIAHEVSELKARGVTFEDYDMPGIKTVNSIATAGGAKSAWFRDTEGNIMALIQSL